MTDPDDELIEKIKELKNRKDILEERVAYLISREDHLQASLLNPIIELGEAIKEVKRGGHSATSGKNNKQSFLQAALVTVRNWVKSNERDDDKGTKKQFEESLNKAITWASLNNPEEEDRVLRKLLAQSLLDAQVWLKHIETTETEDNLKQQLVNFLKAAIDWTVETDGDDELMQELLADYIIIASGWTKTDEEEYGAGAEDLLGRNPDESDNSEEENAARKELLEALIDVFDWINSIKPNPDERLMQHELLDSLTIAKNWVKTRASWEEDEVMKQLLQETLLVSLNWVISVEDEETESLRQKLVDSLIFAINWATSDDTKGDDEVMRTLLRQALNIAMEWKNQIDNK